MDYKQLRKTAEENLSRVVGDYPSIDDIEGKTVYISALANTLRLLIIPLAIKQQKEEERIEEGKLKRSDFIRYTCSYTELQELQLFDNGESPSHTDEDKSFKIGMYECSVRIDREGIMLEAKEVPSVVVATLVDLDTTIFFRPSGGYYYSGSAAVQDAIAIFEKAIDLGKGLDFDCVMERLGFEFIQRNYSMRKEEE